MIIIIIIIMILSTIFSIINTIYYNQRIQPLLNVGVCSYGKVTTSISTKKILVKINLIFGPRKN